jgi:hypothetical protein
MGTDVIPSGAEKAPQIPSIVQCYLGRNACAGGHLAGLLMRARVLSYLHSRMDFQS